MPRGGAGKWASCVRVLEPGTRRTLSLLELPDNEAAVSVATVTLRDRGGEALVFVGTVKDMTLHPRALSAELQAKKKNKRLCWYLYDEKIGRGKRTNFIIWNTRTDRSRRVVIETP